MGKLPLRHEDQMGIERSENNFIMFFKTESEMSLTALFIKPSQHWLRASRAKASAAQPLAAAVPVSHSLDELLKRMEAVSQSPEQMDLANKLPVFLPKKEQNEELCIPFLLYNQETNKLETREDKKPVTLSRMIEMLQEM